MSIKEGTRMTNQQKVTFLHLDETIDLFQTTDCIIYPLIYSLGRKQDNHQEQFWKFPPKIFQLHPTEAHTIIVC